MLYIGTAGIPISAENSDTLHGIDKVKELGLNALELEFVRSVYIKDVEEAKRIGEHAKKIGVHLSIHAPYFINLNSSEKAKVAASEKRIMDSVKVAHYANALSVVIHSAYYMKMDANIVYERVRDEYKKLRKKIVDEGYENVIMRPELMGKHTQFGTVDEIIRLSEDVEGVLPCIDFAHYVARYEKNSYEGFAEIFEKMENRLGKNSLKNVHIHFSDIEYSEKGERRHLVLGDGPLRWHDMVKCWREYKLEGIVISESPNIEIDAIKVKKYYDRL